MTTTPTIPTREALFALTPEQFPPGSTVQLAYPSECSVCTMIGDRSLHDHVTVRNITPYENGWHGYWWCPPHWERYARDKGLLR